MASDEKNVFISHIHKDDAGLDDLKALLDKHGLKARNYSITSDKFNRAKDERYIRDQILGPRIRQCSVMITYISSDTKTSDWVNWEIEYAHKQGIRVVGVWAHGEAQCEVPEALTNVADAVVGWQGNNIIDAIEGRMNDWTGPDGAPRDKQTIARYSCR